MKRGKIHFVSNKADSEGLRVKKIMDLLVGAKNTFKGMYSIPMSIPQSIQSARLSVQSS